MKRISQFLMAIAALAVVVGGNALAATLIWDGGGVGNEFSTADNWDINAVPTNADSAIIDTAVTVDRSVDSATQRVFTRGGGTMNVTGGNHDDSRSGASIYNFVGDNGAGTINQSGGSYRIGHGLRLGVGNTANTLDGTYNLTGGSLDVYRGSNSKIESANPGGRPSIEIGDTAGQGLFEISGGSLLTRAGVHIAPTGTFSVVGSAPTGIDIGPSGSGDGSWIQHGTLQAAIDGGGVTPIFVDDFDDAGGVVGEFKAGSLLDLSFAGISPTPGTWTLMTIENTDIVDGGLALSGSTASGWSFNVDNSGANGLLTVSYIPEPTSFALMMCGGLAALLRRRNA